MLDPKKNWVSGSGPDPKPTETQAKMSGCVWVWEWEEASHVRFSTKRFLRENLAFFFISPFFYFLFTEVWIRKCFTWYMIIIGKITKTKVKKTTHNSQNMEVGLTVSWKQFILFYFIIGISVNLLTCTINDMYKFQGDHGQNVLNRLWLIMKPDWSKNGPRLSFINIH